MFGDIQKNTKKWEMNTLNTIADIRSGGTPSRQNEEYFKGNIPWITTVALGKITINEKDAVEFITEEAIKNSSTKLIPAYSLLFGVRVGVGKISVNTVPMCTNQDIVAIMNIDDNRYNQIFLKNVIDVYFEYFNNQKRGATIQGIKSEVLKNINIPVVDISLQNQFATFVQQVDKSKLAVQKSLEELETLKQALMQQYFGRKEDDKNLEHTGIKSVVLQEIKEFAKKNGVKKVILFGSRARGNFERASDIDLAAEGGDVLQFKMDLKEEASTLLDFDVVDLSQKIQEKLLHSIQKEGIVIYEEI